MSSGLKDGADPQYAAKCAQSARTDKAGHYKGQLEAPKGPAKEPTRLNGVRPPAEKNISKK
jgi:hypothetical protein